MTQTQLIVLFVTFLLASLVVVPLVVIAFRKEKERKEQEVQKARRAIAREEARAKALKEEEKMESIRRESARMVEEYKEVKDTFRDLIKQLYRTSTCEKCESNVVVMSAFDYESGVMQVTCGKCGTTRELYPGNPKDFTDLIPKLTKPAQKYQAVYAYVPNLPDLLFAL